jgi:hypothetical protein
MIELRPPGVTLETKAQTRILIPEYWVKFSDKFPDSLKFVKGKTMRVTKQQQVTYELSYILKEACYYDLNISNEDSGAKLYPNSDDIIYEMIIGLKPGNYYIIPYFPADQPIYKLDYADMTPLVNSSSLKYIGTVRPADSPYLLDDPDNPANAWSLANLKLYLVNTLKPVILRIVADDGVAYEKCTLEFLINRCLMQEGTPAENITPKPIPYLDEVRDL